MCVKQFSSQEIEAELLLELIILAVDRMQWGAEDWQFADLYMPDEPSPYQKDQGVPCVMLIHGGFWKTEYTLELMAPIAEDLAEQELLHGILNSKDGQRGMKVFGLILCQM